MRKALGKERIRVPMRMLDINLPVEQVERIDRHCASQGRPTGGRSEFIRRSIEEELRRVEQQVGRLGMTVNELADGFFADCETDGREPNEVNLRAWLWFTCPARLRGEVATAIRADSRWPQEDA